MPEFLNFLKKRRKAFLSFGVIYAMQMLAPLIVLPWLSRVLGPDSFGLLMYACLLPPVVAIFMDWGLTLGGTRQAARSRGDFAALSALISDVFSARIILAAAIALAGLIALPFVPHASEWPFAYFLAILVGICRGASPLWFFQGIDENLPRMARWDAGASLAGLLLAICLVRHPSQWTSYLLILLVCKGCVYLWLSGELWRAYQARIDFRGGFRFIAATKNLFGASFSTIACANGSQLILGYFLPASQMGLIVAVNKMLRALASIALPFTQTLFPELCARSTGGERKTRALLRASVLTTFGCMGFAAALAWVWAPELLNMALGEKYENGTRIFRLMILAAPLMACNSVLGPQILLPRGYEKEQMTTLALAAVSALPLAAVLGYACGAVGGAIVPVCVETGIMAGLLRAIWKNCPQTLWDNKGRRKFS